MPVYRPETKKVSQESAKSGTALDLNFSLTTMFTAASNELPIYLIVKGTSVYPPVIDKNELPSSTTNIVTINKI